MLHRRNVYDFFKYTFILDDKKDLDIQKVSALVLVYTAELIGICNIKATYKAFNSSFFGDVLSFS